MSNMVVRESSLAKVPTNETLDTLDRISNMLFKCTTVLEVKEIHDKAQVIKTWARCQKAGEVLARDAQIVLTRSSRRLGELLIATPEQRKAGSKLSERSQELRRLGINVGQERIAKQLAQLPAEQFNKSIFNLKNPTEKSVLKDNDIKPATTGSSIYDTYCSIDWKFLAMDLIEFLDELVDLDDKDAKDRLVSMALKFRKRAEGIKR